MKRFDYFDPDDYPEDVGDGHDDYLRNDKWRKSRNGGRHRDGRRSKMKQRRKTSRHDDYSDYE